MQTKDVYNKISELKVIPVIVIDDLEAVSPLADALISGGISIVEITFSTAKKEYSKKYLYETHEDAMNIGFEDSIFDWVF